MKTCNYKDCSDKHYAKGYCKIHYNRLRYKPIDASDLKIELHGKYGTPEYQAWVNMKSRCSDKNASNYKRYGGRGITVCKEWVDSFSAFYLYMGDKPSKNYQIDRINNDGNYEPANCRWVSAKVNVRNSSNTKLDDTKALKIRELYNDGTPQPKIAKLFGVSQSSVSNVVTKKCWS